MAISRNRKFRKTPPDFRYFPWFPVAYREFIKSIPRPNRIHIMPPNFFNTWGGDDASADGTFDLPFATIQAAVDFVAFRAGMPSSIPRTRENLLKYYKPFTKWAFIIYPGTYVTRGSINKYYQRWPDQRAVLFTDFYDNPIRLLPASYRFSTINGKRTDNFLGHVFLNTATYIYEFHFIGAAGKSNVIYQTVPPYYNTVTKRYWDVNLPIAGSGRLADLGLHPNVYTNSNGVKTGNGIIHTQTFNFTVSKDGLYNVVYFEATKKSNTGRRIINYYGNALVPELTWFENYSYHYFDTTNTNPTGNAYLEERGNITLLGDANIDSNFGLTGNSLYVKRGGAMFTHEPSDLLAIGTKNFTIEGKFYLKTSSAVLFSFGSSIKNFYGLEAKYTSGRIEIVLYHNSSSSYYEATYLRTPRVPAGAWHHIVLIRIGTEVHLALNGSIIDSKITAVYNRTTRAWVSTTYNLLANTRGSFYVGLTQNGSFDPFTYSATGEMYVDSFRITVNEQRYAFNNITVPTSDLVFYKANTNHLLPLKQNLSDVASLNGKRPLQLSRIGSLVPTTYSPYSETGNVGRSILTQRNSTLEVLHNDELNLKGDNFIIEFWLLTSSTALPFGDMLSKTATGNNSYKVSLNSSSLTFNFSNIGSSYNLSTSIPLSYNSWNHYLVSRSNSSIRTFKNGTLVSTTSITGNITENSANLYINTTSGSTAGAGTYLIHGLAITKYTSIVNDFTLRSSEPVDPFGNSTIEGSNVVLMLGITGNVLTDASYLQHPVRNKTGPVDAANIVAVPTSPFLYSSSGTSAYLSPPTLSAASLKEPNYIFIKNDPATNNLGFLTSSSWTIDLFYRSDTLNARDLIVLTNSPSPDKSLRPGQFVLKLEGNTLSFRCNRPNAPAPDPGIRSFPDLYPVQFMPPEIRRGLTFQIPGVWVHMAIQLDNGMLKIFQDGTLQIKINTGFNVANDVRGNPMQLSTVAGLYIGRSYVIQRISPEFIGFVHGYRVTNSALYSATNVGDSITVPTKAFSDSEDILLLPTNFIKGAKLNQYGSLRTSGLEYTNYQIYLNSGSGQSLASFNSVTNFTVETFIKITEFHTTTSPSTVPSVDNYREYSLVWGTYSFSGGHSGLFMDETFMFFKQGSTIYQHFVHNMVVGTWYHLTVERFNNTLYFFINGNPVADFAFSGAFLQATNRNVIIGNIKSQSISAYYNNFRISNIPRYQGLVFSPPTDNFVDDANTRLLTCQAPFLSFKTYENKDLISLYTSFNAFFNTEEIPFALPTSNKNAVIEIAGAVSEAPQTPFTSVVNAGSTLFLRSLLSVPVSVSTTTNVVDAFSDFTIEFFMLNYDSWARGSKIVEFVGKSAKDNLNRTINYGNLDWYINASGTGFNIRIPNTSGIGGGSIGFSDYNVSKPLPLVKQWNHFALTRKAGTFQVFLNGSLLLSLPGQTWRLYAQPVFGAYNFAGLISDFRFSTEALYTASIIVDSAPFTLVGDNAAANVAVLALFENDNYKRKAATGTSSIPYPASFGVGYLKYLANGAHTLNVSVVNHDYQGIYGWEVINDAGQVVFESRRDTRDNNIQHFLHPNSSIRGVHIYIPAAKPNFWQNALFSQPDLGFFPLPLVYDIKGNKYDPTDISYGLKKGTSRTVKTKDPETKEIITTVYNSKQGDTTTLNKGTWYNVGISGLEYVSRFSGGGVNVNIFYSTMNFNSVGTWPDYNVPSSGRMEPWGTAGSGKITFKYCIFGGPTANSLNKITLKSLYDNVMQLNYWKYPKSPVYGVLGGGGGLLPRINFSAVGANLIANTLVTTNLSFGNVFKTVGLTFQASRNPTRRYVNDTGANVIVIPALLKGAVAVSNFYDSNSNVILHGTSTLGTGSVYLRPRPNKLSVTDQLSLFNGYPYILIPQSGLPSSNGRYWKISLHIFHEGPFLGEEHTETIFISGDYKGPGQRTPFGELFDRSMQLIARSYKTPRVFRAAAPAVEPRPGVERFKLELVRKGSGVSGRYGTIELSGGDLEINRWYKIDVDYADGLLSLFVNNYPVAEYESNNQTINYPTYDLTHNNNSRLYIGRPPLYGAFWDRRFPNRSWAGYVQYVRVFNGPSYDPSLMGVYAGRYKWVLDE